MPPSPQSSPAITLENAELAFGGLRLFDRLSLALSAGETTALLGPSGVGKSSLLRLLAGLSQSAKGQLSCSDGQALAGRVVYMAQQDLLLPWLTAIENIMLGAKLRGQPQDRQKAQLLLEQVGLASARSHYPAALSGGMRQRVALARTLYEDRPIVLMDEPFSALDAITRLGLQDLAAELLRGKTVLLVTHDPLEALRLGHSVLVMAGRPATLTRLDPPALPIPRSLSAPELVQAQALLLEQLGQAAALQGQRP